MQPISISLHLEDGESHGVRSAAIPGTAVYALAGSRAEIEGVLERNELASPGVYILAGRADNADQPSVYVGESDNVAKRVSDHLTDSIKGGRKPFWKQTYMITSRDGFFNKSHARFVESVLIARAKDVDRVSCSQNRQKKPNLGAVDTNLAETFLRYIKFLLPVMGLDVFTLNPQVEGGSRKRPRKEGDTPYPFSTSKEARRAFWKTLLESQSSSSDLFRDVRPSSEGWISVYRHGFGWAYVVLKDTMRVELFLNSTESSKNKALYDSLYANRQEIESEFGGCLYWQRLDDKKACRISHRIRGGLNDFGEWSVIIDHAVKAMNHLFAATEPGVRAFREAWHR